MKKIQFHLPYFKLPWLAFIMLAALYISLMNFVLFDLLGASRV